MGRTERDPPETIGREEDVTGEFLAGVKKALVVVRRRDDRSSLIVLRCIFTLCIDDDGVFLLR
jgi:hypothetical protein